VPVTSAEEMRAAVMEHLPQATVVIGAAAVADFRMPAVAPEKLRRKARCISISNQRKIFCAALQPHISRARW
jgi:phosphopantothenoylcysteine synthetase/decarboxylase